MEEAILLQAEVLELKASYHGKASGIVIETKIDSTKGVLATILLQKGTLDIGDLIVVGTAFGKRKVVERKIILSHTSNLSSAIQVPPRSRVTSYL